MAKNKRLWKIGLGGGLLGSLWLAISVPAKAVEGTGVEDSLFQMSLEDLL
jgi:hypothetical protein